MHGQDIAAGYGMLNAARTYGPPDAPRVPNGGSATAALEQLHKECEALHAAIATLEARIGFVLAPVPPTTTGASGSTEKPMPTLTNTVRDLAHRVATASARLREITDRVEL